SKNLGWGFFVSFQVFRLIDSSTHRLHDSTTPMKTKLIDSTGFQRTVNRLAHEVVEKNKGGDNLAVVGIRTRGDYLARRVAAKIEELEGHPIKVGTLDITLYRDDLHGRLDQPRLQSTEILFDVTGKVIVLIDDVLFTGRTIRAALNALMDIGRPTLIQLLVLVDRGHRELPIKADFVGKNVPTSSDQEIKVLMDEIDGEDGVYLVDPEGKERPA
ncbi:MAG: bifunctional pyr operon transcriptional regulator/uracil phosphoribosyltransferase PyrR, partial [Bacteroidota bacterium]